MKKKIKRHEISIFLPERHAESCKNYLNFTHFCENSEAAFLEY